MLATRPILVAHHDIKQIKIKGFLSSPWFYEIVKNRIPNKSENSHVGLFNLIKMSYFYDIYNDI